MVPRFSLAGGAVRKALSRRRDGERLGDTGVEGCVFPGGAFGCWGGSAPQSLASVRGEGALAIAPETVALAAGWGAAGLSEGAKGERG